jgi:type 1 fimbria pilin
MRLLLLLLALLVLPFGAEASCTLNGGVENVNISFPSTTIVINPSLPIGSTLISSSQATPVNSTGGTSSVSCGGTTQTGVINLVGTQPSSSSTIFPTGVAGVGYRVTHPSSASYLPAFGGGTIAAGTYNLSVTSGFELVKTGPIANGAVLNAGTLGYWQFDTGQRVENFNLSAAVNFVTACLVNTSTINVTLPTVSNTAFNGVGTVAGATVVPISLNCTAGSKLSIQFDTATPASGFTGVIAPSTTAGSAKNIGVQLVNQSFTPVTFGTPSLVGTTPDGLYTLTYYARYYQTATPVAAGTVNATATFTLTYQ